jgi:hypothetical protein
MNPMKKVMIFSGLIMAPIVIVLALWFIHVLAVAGKSSKFLFDFEKIRETKPPLTTAQVEQLMGQPLRIDHAESTGIVGEVYHYPTYPPGGDFQVIFINGVVFQTALPTSTPKS